MGFECIDAVNPPAGASQRGPTVVPSVVAGGLGILTLTGIAPESRTAHPARKVAFRGNIRDVREDPAAALPLVYGTARVAAEHP